MMSWQHNAWHYTTSTHEFTVDQLRCAADFPNLLRHIVLLAAKGHGKSTLTACLANGAAISKSEELGLPHHQHRTSAPHGRETRDPSLVETPVITLHLCLDVNEEPDETVMPSDNNNHHFFVNMIETPDFDGESCDRRATTLHVADGGLIIVDCEDGFGSNTESILRDVLAERIRPIIFVNKIDHAISELQMDPEELYQGLFKTIQSVNLVCTTFGHCCMNDTQVSPEKGTVAMGSGAQGWAFTVSKFARLYASKFGVDEVKLASRFWGENFFDAKNKKWVKRDTNVSGQRLKRGFCQFCLDPIYQIFDAVMNDKHEKVDKMLKALNIEINTKEKHVAPKEKLKAIMMEFLPAASTLLQMVVVHLPSPVEAQKYRAELLFPGDENDTYVKGIANCDPKAGLVVYIAKMFPTNDKGRYFAFGRVFAGAVQYRHKVVRAKQSNINPFSCGDTTDTNEEEQATKTIQSCLVKMGAGQEPVEDMPAGSLCSFAGLDKFVTKPTTLVDSDCQEWTRRVDPTAVGAFRPRRIRDFLNWTPNVRMATLCLFQGVVYSNSKTVAGEVLFLPAEVAWHICTFLCV